MKTFCKKLAIVALAGVAMLLSACMDVEQDIWINKDGSGRVKIDMGVSKQMLEMVKGLGEQAGGAAGDPFDTTATKERLEADPNVKSVKITERETPKYKHFVYDIEVKDITKLEEVQNGIFEESPAAGDQGPEGEFKIVKLDSGNFKVTAELKGEAPPGGEEPDPAMIGIMKQMFGDAAFTFRVHGPPVKHNSALKEKAAERKMPLIDLATGKSLIIDAEVKP